MSTQPPMQLRAMTVADILDAAIRIYRRNFAPLLGISAVVQVPVMVLQISASYYMMRVMMGGDMSEVVWEQFIPAIGGFFLIILLALVLTPLGEAALAVAVSERYLGRSMTVSGAYSAASKYWGRVLWTSLLYWVFVYLLTAVGTIALIIPGIIVFFLLLTRWLLAPAVVVVLENRWGIDGLRRSWQLTQGHFWSVFATMTILYLILFVVTYGVAVPVQLGMVLLTRGEGDMVLGQLIYQAIVATVWVLLRPLPMIGTILVYYDLRIRKEGFDLMMMAEALGVPPTEEAKAAMAQAPLYPAPPAPPLAPPKAADQHLTPPPSSSDQFIPPPPPVTPPAAPPSSHPEDKRE